MTLNYVQFLFTFYKYLSDKDIQNLKKSYKIIGDEKAHFYILYTYNSDYMGVNVFEHLEIVIFSWDLVTSFEFKQF